MPRIRCAGDPCRESQIERENKKQQECKIVSAYKRVYRPFLDGRKAAIGSMILFIQQFMRCRSWFFPQKCSETAITATARAPQIWTHLNRRVAKKLVFACGGKKKIGRRKITALVTHATGMRRPPFTRTSYEADEWLKMQLDTNCRPEACFARPRPSLLCFRTNPLELSAKRLRLRSIVN
jgi:hypothetical protein